MSKERPLVLFEPPEPNKRRLELTRLWDRRRFLTGVGLGAAAFMVPGAYANALEKTPRQTEGPFFPDNLPLDTDNDLVILGDSLTPAVGAVTHLSGTVRDLTGKVVPGALVELWQVDGNGVYMHSQAPKENQDKHFQGYGRFLTDRHGRYYFRTVKPVPYPGRTPHIHAAISIKGRRVLTTQCYIMGEALNKRDGIYRNMSKAQQDLVTAAFNPIGGDPNGQLQATWDIFIKP